MAEEFRAPAAERHRHVDVDVDVVSAPAAWGDRLGLRQALANLLANAVRLAPAGTTIRVRSGGDATSAWMSVSDDGPGISEEHRSQVFQRFWRGDRSSRDAGTHSGLGLAIVDQIARDHGGRVDLEDSGTGGSTFTIHLPTHRDAR